MRNLVDQDFDALCRAAPVQAALANMEERRLRAVRRFWGFLLGGTAIAVAYSWTLLASGHEILAILGPILWLVTTILALVQTGRWNADLREPVLETLAGMVGMAYRRQGFEPPVYPAARSPLFGDALVGQVFTDLFEGRDEDGGRVAFYQAMLNKPGARNAVTVFYGQVYAYERPSKYSAETAIVPDQGMIKSRPGGSERVRLDGDEAFEKRFDVYSTDPSTALGQLGSELRRRLLQLRESGRVFAYLARDSALVAVAAKVRFEAGNMFRHVPGEQRVRHMFDEVRESLSTLSELRRILP